MKLIYINEYSPQLKCSKNALYMYEGMLCSCLSYFQSITNYVALYKVMSIMYLDEHYIDCFKGRSQGNFEEGDC